MKSQTVRVMAAAEEDLAVETVMLAFAHGAMDLAACTPVRCGDAANDPGVREQRVL